MFIAFQNHCCCIKLNRNNYDGNNFNQVTLKHFTRVGQTRSHDSHHFTSHDIYHDQVNRVFEKDLTLSHLRQWQYSGSDCGSGSGGKAITNSSTCSMLRL